MKPELPREGITSKRQHIWPNKHKVTLWPEKAGRKVSYFARSGLT